MELLYFYNGTELALTLFMNHKTITIEHPIAHLTLIPRRAVPHSVCQKTIRSIEGVLNAALLLAEESLDLPLVTKVSCVEEDDEQEA